MGRLSVISVTSPVPHSACYLDYDGAQVPKTWLGFGPSKHYMPGTKIGKVFRDDESHRVHHGITIRLNDEVMYRAAVKTVGKYSTGPYMVTVRDCVSFSADLVRLCGLNVHAFNFRPYELIQILAVRNKYEKLW